METAIQTLYIRITHKGFISSNRSILIRWRDNAAHIATTVMWTNQVR